MKVITLTAEECEELAEFLQPCEGAYLDIFTDILGTMWITFRRSDSEIWQRAVTREERINGTYRGAETAIE